MQPISTPDQAITRAQALTGLQTIFGLPVARLTKVTDDVTPYLGEENVGKEAWEMEYPPGSLVFAFASDRTDSYRRVFKAVLRAKDGHLLFISSTYEGAPDPEMLPMPSCGDATGQLVNEEEVYNGYPNVDPHANFLAVLGRIEIEGIGSPLQAKEIHGVYVMHSRMGSDPEPAWAITLRGLPPFAAHGPNPKGIPVSSRNFMRNVVDASTGEVLFATNSPQPL